MVKNTRWLQFLEEEQEIPFEESLGPARATCQLPLSTIGSTIAGANMYDHVPHELYPIMNRHDHGGRANNRHNQHDRDNDNNENNNRRNNNDNQNNNYNNNNINININNNNNN